MVEFPDGIDIGDEVSARWQAAGELDLQVAPGIADRDAAILDKALEQVDAFMQHRVPGIPAGVIENEIAVPGPFIEQRLTTVLAPEEGAYSRFKSPPEEHA